MKLHAATALARSVDRVALFATVVSTVLVAVVAFLLVYFCLKYRRGSRADRSGRKSSSVGIELFNIGVLFLFGLTLFAWSARLFYREYSAPPNALELNVLGKQWMWVFQYPNGPQQIGHIKVPVHRPVRILLTSDDVIHSFFVPEFRIKQDALPGTYTSLWFEAEALGRYTVLCTEFCGTSHSAMRATIEVVSAEEFDAYLRHNPPPTQLGAEIYRRLGCAGCHDTGGKVAPPLAGLYGRKIPLANGYAFADENYLRKSLLYPAAQVARGYRSLMPTYKGLLSEPELFALVQYLKALPKGAAP